MVSNGKNILERKHILLFDENAISRQFTVKMLTELKVQEVTVCTDVAQLYNTLKTKSPDAIISRYILQDNSQSTYLFRELQGRKLIDSSTLIVCFVTDDDDFVDALLESYIDITIKYPVSIEFLGKSLQGAMSVHNVIINKKDIFDGDSPEKIIASGKLLAKTWNIPATQIFRLITKYKDDDNDVVRNLLRLLVDSYDEFWIDARTARSLFSSDDIDDAKTLVTNVLKQHPEESDIRLVESKIHIAEGDYTKAMESLNVLLNSKVRSNDIALYQDAVDLTKSKSTKMEYDAVANLLLRTCSMGKNSYLKRESDYVGLCSITLKILLSADNLESNIRFTDADKAINILKNNFPDNTEIAAMAEVFSSSVSYIKRRFDESIEHADKALILLEEAEVSLKPENLTVANKLFSLCDKDEHANQMTTLVASLSDDYSEIVVQTNDLDLSSEDVILTSFAQQALIIVLYNKEKKVAVLANILGVNTSKISTYSDAFMESANLLRKKLRTHEENFTGIQGTGYTLSIYASSDHNQGSNTSNVVEQLKKALQSLNMSADDTQIVDSKLMKVSINVQYCIPRAIKLDSGKNKADYAEAIKVMLATEEQLLKDKDS